MGCHCQKCGRIFKVDILIDDHIWEKITPSQRSKEGGLLCGFCIIEALEGLGYGAFKLSKPENK